MASQWVAIRPNEPENAGMYFYALMIYGFTEIYGIDLYSHIECNLTQYIGASISFQVPHPRTGNFTMDNIQKPYNLLKQLTSTVFFL